jgi:hypothetical protein
MKPGTILVDAVGQYWRVHSVEYRPFSGIHATARRPRAQYVGRWSLMFQEGFRVARRASTGGHLPGCGYHPDAKPEDWDPVVGAGCLCPEPEEET